MNSPDPVPAYFSFRYVCWLIWTNPVTALSTIQGTVATLALAADLFSPKAIKVFLIANAILTALVAQLGKYRTPSPPPTKGP